MNISERAENGITILVVEGRVDSEGANQLDEAIRVATSGKKYKLIMDMANVRYINSVGLRILADALTQNKQHGGDLKLTSLTPKVRRVLEIIGFDRFFSIHDSIDEAVQAFAA